MGMFDWVILKGVRCPVCDSPLERFQTKDGSRLLFNYVAGCRYGDLKHLKYIDVYNDCVHHLHRDPGGPFEPDLHSYSVKKVIWINVKVPILSRGRISSDLRKYKITYEVTEAGQARDCIYKQLSSQVIDEESFNFRKEYEEGIVRGRRPHDQST